ncbi:fanconi-associated nuclease 1-like isoform X2 [Neocloeon triangulifer]|uniref:fanconi-associated nuclease 1-like isoform X2 n=1 Tax=Neocloeon triangulifer TaxID=2078957 RepID=UPI00286F2E81|nr:fanconi-associated nuclease 1-like isoform X2 [Neocloeon triangulifer]
MHSASGMPGPPHAAHSNSGTNFASQQGQSRRSLPTNGFRPSFSQAPPLGNRQPSRLSLNSNNFNQHDRRKALEMLLNPQIPEKDPEEIKKRAIALLKSRPKNPPMPQKLTPEEIKKRAILELLKPKAPASQIATPAIKVRTDLFGPAAPPAPEKKTFKLTGQVENELRKKLSTEDLLDKRKRQNGVPRAGSSSDINKGAQLSVVAQSSLPHKTSVKSGRGPSGLGPTVLPSSSGQAVPAPKPSTSASTGKVQEKVAPPINNNVAVKKVKKKLAESDEAIVKKKAKTSPVQDKRANKNISNAPTDLPESKKSKKDTSDSPELEIISESLVKKKPVVNYGPMVKTNEEPLRMKRHFIDLSSFQSTSSSTSEESTSTISQPKGHVWSVKLNAPLQNNPNNLKFMGSVEEDESDKSMQPKIAAHFSPSKSSSSENSVATEAASTTSSVSPTASKTPPRKRMSVVGEEARKSTFENLTTFKEILISVTVCKHFQSLINPEDMEVIFAFLQVSEGAKALLVQLFKVKHQWKRVSELKHPEIAEDLNPVIDELINSRFLLDSNEMNELREMLELMKVKEVADFMKCHNMNDTKKKSTNIETLLKMGTKQSTLTGNLSTIIERNVRRVLGRCVKVNLDRMDVLNRMCLLESLPVCFQDTSLSDVLFRANRMKFGQLVFPDYEINMEKTIFKDRDAFVEFHKAYRLYKEFEKEFVSKNVEGAALICKEAWKRFKALFESDKKDAREFDEKLPEYLRKFTAGSTLVSTVNWGLDALSKLKEYDSVVFILQDLLAQSCYGMRNRGQWFDRLALVKQKYIKNTNEAAEAIFQGMDDPHVQLHIKVGLAARALSMKTSKMVTRDNKEKLEIYSQAVALSEPPNITIKGKVKTRDGGVVGQKMKFLIESENTDEVVVSSVEDCAIAHYIKNENFTKGRHNEGATVITLMGLLFWEEIYTLNVPDAFICRYQTQPLDLYGIDFYEKRQKKLEKKMKTIEKWTPDESKEHFLKTWGDIESKTSIVNTNAFGSAEEAHSLFECIGAKTVIKICLRLLKDFRNSRSGFPDLVVWAPGKDKYKFIEVKSPNDSLSNNQRVWIDFLMRSGVPVEVCRVNCVGEKFLEQA